MIADASICFDPVSASSASGHGFDIPIASIVFAIPMCLFLRACALVEGGEDAAEDRAEGFGGINHFGGVQ